MAEPFGYRAAGLSDADLRAPFGDMAETRADALFNNIAALGEIRPSLGGGYLVKGWLDRGALSVVYGASNVGKTFFALDLAMHVAAGVDWHGARVPGGEAWPGWVLYIAGEGGRGVFNRVEALRIARPGLVEAVNGAGHFGLLPEGLDLCLGDDTAALSEAIDLMGAAPSLIVVDTLARAMGAGDENSGQDMGRLIRNLDRLRAETGAHVMLIHHSGKDAGKGARGHSSLRAAADTEIELTRSGDVVMAEAKKQRDIPAAGVFAYRLESVVIGTDADGDEITSAVVAATDPVARRPKLSGQAMVALQALDDALAQRGEAKTGDLFPANRQCVSLDAWREYCDRRELSGGTGESSKRVAFHKARRKLQECGFVCIQDGFAWRVEA